MTKQYGDELTGQADFYATYLPLVNRELTMDSIQANNNDGQIGDLLIEFKLNINDINRVLFQTIKYLSALRIKGRPVPNNIVLISLNVGKAYVFKATPYLNAIEQIYMGGASKDNAGFVGQKPLRVLNYLNNNLDEAALIELFKDAYKRDVNNDQDWLPVHIDGSNIVGWATTYYKMHKGATKASFLGDDTIIGEIRQPNYLKGMILPYQGADNAEFGYIMDKLNDDFQKKDLGAFFTPPLYAKKSHDLVYDAIRRFQTSGNSDYIILDRCAGTGNLELDLNQDVPDDILDKDVLSHVIVNTYEYYEYKVLMERLGDKVRYVIPPHTQFTDGTVAGSNALSKEFLENAYVKQYLDNDDCTIIMYENPPFAETTSIDHQKQGNGKKSGTWKQELVVSKAKQVLKGAQSNDMCNVFIWSALSQYLRQPSDSYVVFSPIKYWKMADNWMNYKFEKGYAFNRRWFHTTNDTTVSCILWSNQKSNNESFELKIFDINNYELSSLSGTVIVNRVHSMFSSSYYDSDKDSMIRTHSVDLVRPANMSVFSSNEISVLKSDGDYLNPDISSNKPILPFWCANNGLEYEKLNYRVGAHFNSNIVGYMVTQSNTFELPASNTFLIRQTRYNGHGFHLRSDNYLSKLPMFAAGWWSTYNPKEKWYLNGVIYRSGDGADKYNADMKSGKLDTWLHQVLFYTCLEYYNKIRSLHGSDDRWYFNELCLDDNKGKVDNPIDKSDNITLASAELKDFLTNLDDEEQRLYDLWVRILAEARQTKNYDANYNYGVFQITQELNTKHVTAQRNGRKTYEYDYPELNGDLKSLRKLIKDYYHTHIQDNLFKYEFLK